MKCSVRLGLDGQRGVDGAGRRARLTRVVVKSSTMDSVSARLLQEGLIQDCH